MSAAAATAPRQELHLLTPMRGIAATLVVLYHLADRLPAMVEAGSPLAHFVHRGHLWVDYFFVLSGFVLTHVHRDRERGLAAYGGFLRKRLYRIYPLHLFVLLWFVVAELIGFRLGAADAPPFATPDRSLASLGWNVLLVHNWGLQQTLTWNGPSWSISSEWAAYLAFPWLAILALGRWRKPVAAAIALGAAATLARLELWRGDLGVTFDFGTVRCLVEFALGVALYGVFLAAQRRHVTLPGALAAALLAAIAGQFAWSAVPVAETLTVLTMPALVLTLALLRPTGLVHGLLASAPLRWLGERSYSIYMTHGFLVFALRVAFARGQVDAAAFGPWASWAIVAGFLVVVGLVSEATYRGIERPFQRLARRRAAATAANRE